MPAALPAFAFASAAPPIALLAAAPTLNEAAEAATEAATEAAALASLRLAVEAAPQMKTAVGRHVAVVVEEVAARMATTRREREEAAPATRTNCEREKAAAEADQPARQLEEVVTIYWAARLEVEVAFC